MCVVPLLLHSCVLSRRLAESAMHTVPRHTDCGCSFETDMCMQANQPGCAQSPPFGLLSSFKLLLLDWCCLDAAADSRGCLIARWWLRSCCSPGQHYPASRLLTPAVPAVRPIPDPEADVMLGPAGLLCVDEQVLLLRCLLCFGVPGVLLWSLCYAACKVSRWWFVAEKNVCAGRQQEQNNCSLQPPSQRFLRDLTTLSLSVCHPDHHALCFIHSLVCWAGRVCRAGDLITVEQ